MQFGLCLTVAKVQVLRSKWYGQPEGDAASIDDEVVVTQVWVSVAYGTNSLAVEPENQAHRALDHLVIQGQFEINTRGFGDGMVYIEC